LKVNGYFGSLEKNGLKGEIFGRKTEREK